MLDRTGAQAVWKDGGNGGTLYPPYDTGRPGWARWRPVLWRKLRARRRDGRRHGHDQKADNRGRYWPLDGNMASLWEVSSLNSVFDWSILLWSFVL